MYCMVYTAVYPVLNHVIIITEKFLVVKILYSDKGVYKMPMCRCADCRIYKMQMSPADVHVTDIHDDC